MKYSLWLSAAVVVGLLASGTNAGGKGDGEVTLDGLKSKVSASWKSQKPSNKFRAYQFVVPKAEGDKKDAELVIFFFGEGSGGTVEENLKRWKDQFRAPEGKTIDDVSTLKKMKVGNVAITYLDIHGIYLSKFPPFDPNAKVTRLPDYRSLSVYWASEKGPYFIRLTGPAKTVAHHQKEFDHWLKNFK